MEGRPGGLEPIPSHDEVVERILARLKESAGISETGPGSVARTLAEAFALEVVGLHERILAAYEMGFIDSAEGAALDSVVALLGVKRKGARYASGTVVFSRAVPMSEVVIAAGTRVSCMPGSGGGEGEERDDPMPAEPAGSEEAAEAFGEHDPLVLPPGASALFETTVAVRLPRGTKEVEVPVRAITAGIAGTVEAGSIVRLDTPLIGIDEVHNPLPTSLGTEPESDDELRDRCRAAMLAAGKSTPEGLRSAVLRVHGVREASVREAPNGVQGEVELVLDGVDLEDADTVARLRAALEPRRPAGIKISLAEVRKVLLAIEASVTLRDGASESEAVMSVSSAIRREVARLPPGSAVQRNRLLAAALQVPEVREVDDLWLRTRSLDRDSGTLVDDTRSREGSGDISVGVHERAEVERIEVHTQWSPREFTPVLISAKVVATLESSSLRVDTVRERLAAGIDSYMGQMKRGEPLDYSRLRAIARAT
ncbi:MAG TPA: baseplate J/gp47 family protein, partial [Thermoplasmata archaeon]|nr:baseplate J/gp47 family protein [Thermoplasmata archaeon]